MVTDEKDDFFDLGGGSLTAAQMVSRLRARYPEVTVADLYEHPTVQGLTSMLDEMSAPTPLTNRKVQPTPSKTQIGQVVFTVPLRLLSGLRWLTWVVAGNNLASAVLGLTYLPTFSWWWVLAGWLAFVFAPGRMALSVVGARILLRNVGPGRYPRGGRVHLRLWLAERLAEELGATNLAGAAWMTLYARALGATTGRRVDLHSLPPVTGLLHLGDGCSVEPEVDLSGHWLDGDVLHIGRIEVGSGARVGTRSTLGPGALVGSGAEVAPGSSVIGPVATEASWAGSPAESVGPARGPWSTTRPEHRASWVLAYAGIATGISLLPILALLSGFALTLPWLLDSRSLGQGAQRLLVLLPLAAVCGFVVLAVLVVALV